MNLNQFGWSSFFEKAFKTNSNENLLPGRVITEHGKYHKVVTEQGELQTELTGKFKFTNVSTGDLPAVGDWVLVEKLKDEPKGLIHEILPRLTKFSRKMAGSTNAEQVLVANFDTIFIFNSLNQNFNIRRIERYLALAWESGAVPVVILSKADLCEDFEQKLEEVKCIAPGADVYAISSKTGYGVEELRKYFKPGKTVALLGSSGEGKSTLVNTLAEREVLKVQEVREYDDRGRHTTTHREMIVLPNGSLVVDTPGMRELALWQSSSGLMETFSDIEEIASDCRFNDCKHIKEPGCAILQAIEEGVLDVKRYESYLKLQKEARYIESKANERLRLDQKKRGKEFSKYVKSRNKEMW